MTSVDRTPVSTGDVDEIVEVEVGEVKGMLRSQKRVVRDELRVGMRLVVESKMHWKPKSQ